MKHEDIKKYIITAMCIAIGIVLPIAFHSVPNGGVVFCPMHLPVLLCGVVCGWQFGLLCGIVCPILSMLLTGMPNAATLPSMVVELAVFGVVTALMMKLVKFENIYIKLYSSLIVAMLSGRVVASLIQAFVLARGSAISAIATTHFVTCLPGIVIQLVLIPAIYVALMKIGIIKYERKIDNDTDYYYYKDEDEQD